MIENKLYLTINSIIPKGFIGWKELALKICDELDCIIVHKSRDLVDTSNSEIKPLQELMKKN